MGVSTPAPASPPGLFPHLPGLPPAPTGSPASSHRSLTMPTTVHVHSACQVMQEDDDYAFSWFVGEVKGHGAPDKVQVEYEELMDEDDETGEDGHWATFEKVLRVRPQPEPIADHASWAKGLTAGATIQIKYIGGWWDVVLLSVKASKYTVKSLQYEAEHTVEASMLRPTPAWKWELASKSWKQRPYGNEVGGAADADDDDEVCAKHVNPLA